MATNEGGATPMKVPIQNGANRTSITGDTMLMNQFGKNGVILKVRVAIYRIVDNSDTKAN